MLRRNQETFNKFIDSLGLNSDSTKSSFTFKPDKTLLESIFSLFVKGFNIDQVEQRIGFPKGLLIKFFREGEQIDNELHTKTGKNYSEIDTWKWIVYRITEASPSLRQEMMLDELFLMLATETSNEVKLQIWKPLASLLGLSGVFQNGARPSTKQQEIPEELQARQVEQVFV